MGVRHRLIACVGRRMLETQGGESPSREGLQYLRLSCGPRFERETRQGETFEFRLVSIRVGFSHNLAYPVMFAGIFRTCGHL